LPLSISYMGTKQRIAPIIADVAASAKQGPFLDLFSGICAVGAAVGTKRGIWCNDVQIFASLIAEALFLSTSLSPTSIETAEIAFNDFQINRQKLENRFKRELDKEVDLLSSEDIDKIQRYYSNLPHAGVNVDYQSEVKRLHKKPNTFPYRLFAITYAGGYIGLMQAIEIDSIRYTMDKLRDNGTIDQNAFRWWVIALCQAICKVATTTGHSAQYLKINDNNVQNFINQRKKSIWLHWLEAVDNLVPIGWKEYVADVGDICPTGFFLSPDPDSISLPVSLAEIPHE
jgi:adenine-specific DNA-methyltransferase